MDSEKKEMNAEELYQALANLGHHERVVTPDSKILMSIDEFIKQCEILTKDEIKYLESKRNAGLIVKINLYTNEWSVVSI